MTTEKRWAWVACVLVAGLLLAAGGCGRGGGSFKLKEMGFSMKLPPGWKQGEPRASGGYNVTSNGSFFFEDASRYDPWGNVMETPLDGASLQEHVDKLIELTEKMEDLQVRLTQAVDKMTGGVAGEEMAEAESALHSEVLSKQPRTVGGLQAIEVVTDAPTMTLTVYILRGENVVVVTFGAPKEDFPAYEDLFREASETIRFS